MWNPFRRIKIEPIIPKTDIKPSEPNDLSDAEYRMELLQSQTKTLLARQQLLKIYDQLATNAVSQLRGDEPCPD